MRWINCKDLSQEDGKEKEYLYQTSVSNWGNQSTGNILQAHTCLSACPNHIGLWTRRCHPQGPSEAILWNPFIYGCCNWGLRRWGTCARLCSTGSQWQSEGWTWVMFSQSHDKERKALSIQSSSESVSSQSLHPHHYLTLVAHTLCSWSGSCY